jgi:hypothetical protein
MGAILGEASLLGEFVIRELALRAQTAVGPVALCRDLFAIGRHDDCQ